MNAETNVTGVDVERMSKDTGISVQEILYALDPDALLSSLRVNLESASTIEEILDVWYEAPTDSELQKLAFEKLAQVVRTILGSVSTYKEAFTLYEELSEEPFSDSELRKLAFEKAFSLAFTLDEVLDVCDEASSDPEIAMGFGKALTLVSTFEQVFMVWKLTPSHSKSERLVFEKLLSLASASEARTIFVDIRHNHEYARMAIRRIAEFYLS